MIDQISELLHQRGYRMTPQRLVILNILIQAGCHLSPIEICHRAQSALPGMTEATVYRTLNFFTQQGFVLAAHIGNGQLMYEIALREHHHLICRCCGANYEIEHRLLERLYQQFQEITGFQIDGMHVTFFGLCPQCQVSVDPQPYQQ